MSLLTPTLTRRLASTPRLTSLPLPTRSHARRHASTPSMANKNKIETPSEYCADLVKKLDQDAWLCSQFWPAKGGVRDMWLALRAFNLELFQVQSSVSQPTIAMMRYQFWRDSLKAIWDDKPPKNPVCQALHEVKKRRPVQRYYLKQMIDVRANAVSGPTQYDTLQQYIDSQAPLQNALLLGSLPLLIPPTHPSTSDISHTLTHLSSLLSVVSLLRSLPFAAGKRQWILPREMAKHGIVEEEVFRLGGEAKGVKDSCFEIATRGMDELITARSHLKEDGGKVKPEVAMPVFLSAVPAERYLKRLEALDFNPFHPDLQKADWKLAPSIWWTAWSGKL